jgi:hypothetical protein
MIIGEATAALDPEAREREKKNTRACTMNQFREFVVNNKNESAPMVSIGAAGGKVAKSNMSKVSAFSSDDEVKPRVHFARKKKFRGIVSFNCMSMKQRDSLWYTSAELEMKKHHEVRSISSDSGLLPFDSDIQEINKMFLQSRWLSTTMSEAEMDEALQDSDVLKQHTEGLDRFLESGTSSFRGLEEWISTPERYLRLETARATRIAFITASSKLTSAKNKDRQDEMLAEEYRKQSRAAKLYARLLAEVDARAAVKSQGDGEAEEKIDPESHPS